MKKLFTRLVLAVMVVSASVLFTGCGGKLDKHIQAALDTTVEQLNASAPLMLNDDVRFDKSEVKGKELVYYYTIINPANVDNAELEKSIRQDLKANTQLTYLAEADITMTYKYRDADGKDLLSFSVKSSDYK